ncbi:MAG: hypothetical protein ABW051_11700 [Burkholderiaceae bacterium]
MHRICGAAAAGPSLALLAVASLLAACTPSLNWRDVPLADTGLVALLPCKPDKGERTVPLGGREVTMKMAGCEASGALFALASATLPDAAQAGAVLVQWQAATAANMKAQAPAAAPFVPPGAAALPEAVLVSARGVRADGSAVESRAAYFSAGARVYQAVIYADRLDPAAAETFFSSLKFR